MLEENSLWCPSWLSTWHTRKDQSSAAHPPSFWSLNMSDWCRRAQATVGSSSLDRGPGLYRKGSRPVRRVPPWLLLLSVFPHWWCPFRSGSRINSLLSCFARDVYHRNRIKLDDRPALASESYIHVHVHTQTCPNLSLSRWVNHSFVNKHIAIQMWSIQLTQTAFYM